MNWVFAKCAEVGENSVEGGGGVTEGGRLLGPKFLGPGVVDPVTSFPVVECTHSPQSAPLLSFNSRLTQESVPARQSPRKEQDL